MAEIAEIATSTHVQLGKIQYVEPDTSDDPWNSAYKAYMIALLPNTVTQVIHSLHGLRPSIFQSPSPYTLSTHAFTAIKHTSIMHSAPFTLSSFYEPSILVDHYTPEADHLVKAVTRASKVLTLNCAVRNNEAPPPPKTASQLAREKEEDPNPNPKPEMKRDVDLNKIVITNPNNATTKIGPARSMHIDTSPAGARALLRNIPQILDYAALTGASPKVISLSPRLQPSLRDDSGCSDLGAFMTII